SGSGRSDAALTDRFEPGGERAWRDGVARADAPRLQRVHQLLMGDDGVVAVGFVDGRVPVGRLLLPRAEGPPPVPPDPFEAVDGEEVVEVLFVVPGVEVVLATLDRVAEHHEMERGHAASPPSPVRL